MNETAFGEHIGCLSPFEQDITDCDAPGMEALVWDVWIWNNTDISLITWIPIGAIYGTMSRP